MKIITTVCFVFEYFLITFATQHNVSKNTNHPVPTSAATKVDKI